MKALIAASAVVAMVVCMSAVAADFPRDRIAVMVSEPGADKIAFLSDVGRRLRAFSDETGFEACAGIAADVDRYGVVITTSRSHVGCSIDPDDTPDGMYFTGETIHSHGRKRATALNKQDMMFATSVGKGGTMVRVLRMDADNFSPTDYAVPGYLAGKRGLYYQNGEGTQTKVSSR